MEKSINDASLTSVQPTLARPITQREIDLITQNEARLRNLKKAREAKALKKKESSFSIIPLEVSPPSNVVTRRPVQEDIPELLPASGTESQPDFSASYAFKSIASNCLLAIGTAMFAASVQNFAKRYRNTANLTESPEEPEMKRMKFDSDSLFK